MKKIITIFLTFILFFNSTASSFAIVSPINDSNNKFGIHIFSEKDLPDAATLVNSSGGDWGYITVVITEAERDRDRWQQVFDQMRRIHLIPIVRLATKANGATWDAPQEAEINNWVSFLNSLNWVVQNRYVVINNEPNHAAEWGGRLDPAGYAAYLKEFSQKLKKASPDFFVLPAGLDPSSSNTTSTMTSSKYISKMIQGTPDVFNFVDGWTSHAYPNVSISIYNQELEQIGKNLPVFITETGWPRNKYSDVQIGQNLVHAYKNIWNDPNVVAVTPFILDYTAPPFDIYSWEKKDGTFYSYFDEVKNISKIKGAPTQIESGQILAAFAQPIMINGVDFVGAILVRNNGQTIWSSDTVFIGNESTDFALHGFSMNNIEPTKLGLIFFRAGAIQNNGIYTNSVFLTGAKKQRITNSFSIEGVFVTISQDFMNGLLVKVAQMLPK